MTDWLALGISLAIGTVAALLHFGGLWLTVRRIPSSSRPALLMLGSSLARTGLTLTGFFAVATVDSRQLPLCLVAFLLTRVGLLRRLGRQAPLA